LAVVRADVHRQRAVAVHRHQAGLGARIREGQRELARDTREHLRTVAPVTRGQRSDQSVSAGLRLQFGIAELHAAKARHPQTVDFAGLGLEP